MYVTALDPCAASARPGAPRPLQRLPGQHGRPPGAAVQRQGGRLVVGGWSGRGLSAVGPCAAPSPLRPPPVPLPVLTHVVTSGLSPHPPRAIRAPLPPYALPCPSISFPAARTQTHTKQNKTNRLPAPTARPANRWLPLPPSFTARFFTASILPTSAPPSPLPSLTTTAPRQRALALML